ncbi:MAG: hypothetical protein JWM77_2810 [Rhodospirillales bacterium]|jgi:hypothetical protein|nr:hypothetical protein [Rhodospirillales bacterium]
MSAAIHSSSSPRTRGSRNIRDGNPGWKRVEHLGPCFRRDDEGEAGTTKWSFT